jgi:hypothetical protein
MAESYVSTADAPIEVPFTDDEAVRDEELITDEPGAGLSAAEKLSRDQKKQERIREKLNRGKQSEAENVRLRAESEELKTRIARLEGAVSVQTRQPPAPAQDPYKAALATVRQRQTASYEKMRAEMAAQPEGKDLPPDRLQHYQDELADIEDEKAQINARKVLAQQAPAIRQEQAQQVYVQKYPDVYSNPTAFEYAQGTFARKKALGEAITNETVDEIMQETRTVFKIGPKPSNRPSASERARLSGHPSSGASGGGRDPSGGIAPTPALMKMAKALHSDLPDDQAFKKWVDGPGKELRKQKVL